MNKNDIYIAMYRAMDCLYWEAPKEGLLRFVSEANPYLWTNGRSADPWVQHSFDLLFEAKYGERQLSYQEAYDFVCEYLVKMTQKEEVYRAESTDLCEVFRGITLPEWIELCKIILEEAAEE